MADSNAPKKYVYVAPTPPANLINLSSFTVDFNGRKFIQVGHDPSHNFTVVIQKSRRHKQTLFSELKLLAIVQLAKCCLVKMGELFPIE